MPRLSNPSDSRIWCCVLNRTIGPRGSVAITEDEARAIRDIQVLVVEHGDPPAPIGRVLVRHGMGVVEAASDRGVERR